MSSDETILEELHEDYDTLKNCWSDARKERAIDTRYALGDPWSRKDRKKREDNGRPCVSHDELRQYLNQAIGTVRQNKRGIKLDPDGKGASNKTAELHQDIIRTIETKCSASSIYISSGYEPALRGGYGFFKITRQYAHDDFDEEKPENNARLSDQEIVIKPILNPDSVLFDWDCKEADWSDARKAIELYRVPIKEFTTRWPGAKKVSFDGADIAKHPAWVNAKELTIASYWKVKSEFKTAYILKAAWSY